MLCTSELARMWPDAPEALRNFWKAPVGARLRFSVNSEGLLRYTFTKRDLNRVGLSSLQRPNDFDSRSMDVVTRQIMQDPTQRLEFIPAERRNG